MDRGSGFIKPGGHRERLALNRSDATCVSVHDVAFADRDNTEVPNQPVEEGINKVTNRALR
jgi:hypothetical protein